MFIKIYLSEAEKKQLEKIAEKKGLSVSKLCYEQILPLLTTPFSFTGNLSSAVAPMNQKNDKSVKVYFTDDEYKQLVSDAKGMSLSRYVRKEFLSRKEPVKIFVYTEDISSLALQVSWHIEHLRNFIAALAIRRQLYESDYERLIQIADDTKTALKDAAKYAYANRKSIRASGVRILRKEIQNAVDRMTSYKDGVSHDCHL